ncbi:MAG: hypothetical protein KME26_20820 [Oscillatoria princeps RMCB-10]|nr:hypothetical protein [Oscillatoria princeps RMCB-10]
MNVAASHRSSSEQLGEGRDVLRTQFTGPPATHPPPDSRGTLPPIEPALAGFRGAGAI